jgi:hypothetical protein
MPYAYPAFIAEPVRPLSGVFSAPKSQLKSSQGLGYIQLGSLSHFPTFLGHGARVFSHRQVRVLLPPNGMFSGF